MASATAFPRNEPDPAEALIRSRRWSLTGRILAVNIFALAMLAGSFVYLDNYRTELADERVDQFDTDATLMAVSLAAAPPATRPALATALGRHATARVRVYGRDGSKRIDGWARGRPTYELRDPRQEPWRKHVARFMDRAFDSIVGASPLDDYVEPVPDRAEGWPELRAVMQAGMPESTTMRRAPDRTPMISSARPLPEGCCSSPATRATSPAPCAPSASPSPSSSRSW